MLAEDCRGAAHKPPKPPRQYTITVKAGERYGARVVTEADLRNSKGQRVARVRCDCGREQVTSLQSIVQSRSCGHDGGRGGMSKHPLYKVHFTMMARCYREGSRDYRRYGGRGVRVHEPWHDPQVFVAEIEALLGPRPDGCYPSGWPRYSLDRWPDPAGNYEPGNVRWATAREQRHNQRQRPQ